MYVIDMPLWFHSGSGPDRPRFKIEWLGHVADLQIGTIVVKYKFGWEWLKELTNMHESIFNNQQKMIIFWIQTLIQLSIGDLFSYVLLCIDWIA